MFAKGHQKLGGKPKGYKAPETRSKEAIRAHVQARVAAELDPLLDAQLAQARGLKYVVGREKLTGQFVRLTKRQTERILSGHDDKYASIEVWSKDPSTPAFTDLMNRAADKPAEQMQQIQVTGELTMVTERLEAARKRLAAWVDPKLLKS